MKTKRWLFAAFAAVLVLVVACGGGGGGNGNNTSAASPVAVTPQAPPPSATGSVVLAKGCTIAEDASTCVATLSYTTANASAPSLKVGTAVAAMTASATNLSVTIGDGSVPVMLYDGTTVLDGSKTIAGVCDTDTAWDGKKCTRVVLHYNNITVGVANFFGVVDSAGFHRSINKSTHTSGALPVSSCLLPEDKLADGRIPILCYAVDDSMFHVFALNPITNEFVEYNKPMPAGYEYTPGLVSASTVFGPKWHECQYSGCLYGGAWGTPPFPYMLAWASDGKGGYYFVPTQAIPGTIITNLNSNLYEQDAAGMITLVWEVPPPVYTSGGQAIVVSSITALETFSN